MKGGLCMREGLKGGMKENRGGRGERAGGG